MTISKEDPYKILERNIKKDDYILRKLNRGTKKCKKSSKTKRDEELKDQDIMYKIRQEAERDRQRFEDEEAQRANDEEMANEEEY